MQRSAPLILGLSLVLLLLVGVDFIQVQQLSKETERSEQKSDLVSRAREIGQVLNESSSNSYLYKFYLKDETGTAITSSSKNSEKALIKGATVTVTNKSSFTCGDDGSNYTFADYDGLYKISCGESATMNIRISKSGYNTKNMTLAVYNGEIPTIYLSRYVAPPPPPPPETIKDVKLPAEFSETGGSTNLSAIADPSKVENLTLDTNSNTIKYTEVVDLSATDTKDKFKELNKYVNADKKGVVGVDSTNLAALNKKATITMKSLGFTKTPKILVDGKDAGASVTNVVYKDGTLTFDVTKFSTYVAAPTIDISEPENNFETKDKKMTVRGSVSDPTATVSAQLNNRDLGKVQVATDSGIFSKEIELDEGSNKIVLAALGSTLATASASVSGTLVKAANLAWVYLVLLMLLAVALAGGFYGFKKMRKGKTETAKVNPSDSTPPTPTI